MVFNLLKPPLREVLKRYGYVKPTPIQERAIPVLLKGYSCIIVSPTGSGKTEAAFFPAINSVIGKPGGVRVLYITPLRALNRDILRRMKSICSEVGVRLEIRHGDTSAYKRRLISANPPEILITTPETLQFLLVGAKIGRALKRVECVIIDEVHELLSSKRGIQLLLALERLEMLTKRPIQRVGLSATVWDPEAIKRAIGGGRRVVVVSAAAPRRYVFDIVPPSELREISVEDAVERLIDVIEKNGGKCLIFVNTRDTAELLGVRLKQVFGDIVAVHHGSLNREERIKVESAFKSGKIRVLICTSSMELGVDIGDVDYVIQFGSPRQVSRLLQRVGRAQHRLSGEARGILVISDINDLLEALVLIARAKKGLIEPITIYKHPLDVLAHQIVGIVLQERGISVRDVYRLVTRAHPYRDLSYSDFRAVVEFLERLRFIRVLDDGSIIPRRPARDYYFTSASTIPDVKTLTVVDITSGKKVGELDEGFVAANLEPGDVFVLGGKAWEVVGIDWENMVLRVSPAVGPEAVVPAWTGEDIPVDRLVAREVGSILRRLADKNSKVVEKTRRYYAISDKVLTLIREAISEYEKTVGDVPSDKHTVIEQLSQRDFVINTFIGTKGNYGLGLLVTYELAARMGISASFRADAYRLVITCSKGIDANAIKAILAEGESLLSDIDDAIRKASVYYWKFTHVAQRFGIVSKKSDARLTRSTIDALRGTPADTETLNEIKTSRIDVEAIRWYLRAVENGLVRVTIKKVGSPLALSFRIAALSMYGKQSYLALPAKTLFEVVKKRLLSSRVRLVCLHCGKWSSELKVEELGVAPKCPICGSRVIAIIPWWDENTLRAISRWKRGVKLSREEKLLIKSAQQSALLYLSYGKKAAMVLAGRGIGPQTATRILKTAVDEESLLRAVVEAEATYARTRPYWKNR